METGWGIYNIVFEDAYFDGGRLVVQFPEADSPTGWIAEDYADNLDLSDAQIQEFLEIAEARASQ